MKAPAGLSVGLLCTSIMFASGAFAQETPVPQEPPTFLSGAWATDSNNRVTALSAGLPAAIPEVPIRIYSAYYADGVEVVHMATTDRGDASVTIPESSGAVIEGRNIELRQGSTGSLLGGGWRALQQPIGVDQFSSFGWAVHPGKSTQVLDLAEQRQFVLLFGGHTNPPCNNGRLRITVDGKPLNYRNGNRVQLIARSSIWSYGKSVVVTWTGTCTLPTPAPVGATPLAHGTVKVAH